MKKIFFILPLLLFLVANPLFAQTKAETKEMFLEAESYFLFEEYNEALPIYLQLLKLEPENTKLNYRTGICYLNTPGQKKKAIGFLEKAIKDINPNYKERSISETGAPLDAYFYLGDAYRVNNMLDKAIETYEYFKNNLDEKVYDKRIVEHQIETCNNAIRVQKTPLFLSYQNLGTTINTKRSDYNPVISGDEKTLVYTQELAFYDAVFFSQKINGKWTNPRNLTPDFQIDQDFYSSSLSFDGKLLYLYKNDNYDGNIYTSEYVDGLWQVVKKLNENINTKYWESHACQTKDGQTLYFTSNRKGGYGGLDIYRSEKDSLGQWGPAVNLGPNINTSYNEETPFISADGKTLYFSSYGHFNIGGYDIFYSSLFDNNEWSTPLNMGYPINTPDNDLFYQPAGDGNIAYYSMFSESGIGGKDLFRLAIYSDEHPRKFLITGIVSLGIINNADILHNINIHVIESSKNDTTAVLNPDSKGAYSLELKAGEYDISFEGEGFESFNQHLSLPNSREGYIVELDETHLSLKDITADLNLMDSTYVMDQDTIDIKLSVEPASILTVETYRDSTLLSSEEFLMTDSVFVYRHVPVPGQTNIKFILTDKFGNTKSMNMDIHVPAPVPPVILAGSDETLDEDSIEVSTKDEEELIAFINRLSKYAEGDLKATIDEADPEASNISDSKSFVNYLLEQAKYRDYTEADVNILLMHTAARNNKNLLQFFTNLHKNSSGELRALLDTLQLDKNNISNIEELIAFINFRIGVEVSKEELQEAIAQMAVEEDEELARMRSVLDSLAEGELKEVLKELEPEKENIYSTYELVSFLLDNADILGYTEEELAILLANMSGNGDPDLNGFLKKMISASLPGNLKTALEQLNLEQEDINSIQELIRYLLEHKDELGYSTADLMNLLIDIIAETDIDISKVKDLIQEEAKESKGMGTGMKAGLLILVLAASASVLFIVWKRKKKED